MSIEKRIIEALQRTGIFIEYDEEKDIDLSEEFANSLQFMSAVLELELEFKIEFPDEYLMVDKFLSLKGLALEIEEFMNSQT